MITIQKLEWSDCFSYGEGNSIDTTSNQITQLVGKNGSGKSSIALILQEVLYNKNSKGVKKTSIPNRSSDKPHYRMYCEFSTPDHDYSVEVIRKSNIKVTLLKDGEDISSHTAPKTFQTIQEIIGLDFKTFVQLIYQSTTTGIEFLTATDTTRKRFLINLFGLDEYDKYFEVFKSLSAEISKEIDGQHRVLKALEDIIAKNSSSELTLKEPRALPEEKQFDEIVELRQQLANVDKVNPNITRNNRLKKELLEITIDEAYLDMEIQETNTLRQELGSLDAKRLAVLQKLDKLNKLSTSTCPTCLQDVNEDFTNTLTEDLRVENVKLEEAIQRCTERISTAERLNKEIKKNKSLEERKKSLLDLIDESLPSDLISSEELNKKLKTLVQEKNRYDALVQEVSAHNKSVDIHNSKVQTLREQLADRKNEANKASVEIQKLQEKLASVNTLKKVFSTNGLVAYKLENLVISVEELINKYLSSLSEGRFTLAFTLDKDKLNISITDNGKEIDINELSTGELTKVEVATLLAIRKLLNSISKTQINVLFLDEVINVLDTDSREALIDVLLEEHNLNTFLVSHGWTHPLLSKLTITKEGSKSIIKYG